VWNYGRRIVVDLPFDLALADTITSLQDEGVDVVSRLDVGDYLDRTIHHDCRQYVWLQVVMPRLTLDALRHDLEVGAILPTTIAIFELADGETAVVVSEPFGGLASNAEWRRSASALATLADQACDRLAHALSRLEQAAVSTSRSAMAIGSSASFRLSGLTE
jgi:uncharacterized protein (DUF302 family)